MSKLSLQITEIENGWIVAIPPSESEIRAASVSQRQPQGRVSFCEDYEAVCNTLKSEWPKK